MTSLRKEAVPAAKETIREATEAFKSGATETLQTARQTGEDYLADQKLRLASKLDEYTTALDAACESLQKEDQNPLAGPARRAARGLEQAASYLRETSRTDVLHDLGDLARKRPEWFYGAIFVAGLATARFLKALPPRASAGIGGYPPRATPAMQPERSTGSGSEPFQPFTKLEP